MAFFCGRVGRRLSLHGLGTKARICALWRFIASCWVQVLLYYCVSTRAFDTADSGSFL